ncbi:MAG: RluA family pseudouridine synthase [Mycoplasmataceae bacterium]|jgi:23S rRNA pseudouridine1911/1915/1917 synthase|nr:RluA family pseudouridine synthase [Mycoplasmataceae bacterium]
MTKIKVSGLNQKIRLDLYLTQLLQQKRNYIDKLLDNKMVLVNHELPIKKGQLIDNDFLIEVNPLVQNHIKIKATLNEVKIIYEDNDIIVINKPKHTLVHPTKFDEQNTLVNALITKINLPDFDDQLRPGVVHRLDRDTTGLVVFAKNKHSYTKLVEQIQNKTLVRKYLAIVHNNFQDDFVLVKAPIDRSKQNILKMVVNDSPKAKPAQTEITVLENYRYTALIECRLLTGRTHQIRVHLAYIHHPVYNDKLYGSYDGYKDYGQFLHAHYLSFIHPTTNQVVEFKVKPDQTFNSLITKLKGDK